MSLFFVGYAFAAIKRCYPIAPMIFVKFIVLLILIFVLISLFSGLYFLVKDKGQTKRTVNALTIRIGLSVLIIVVLLIAAATGVIEFNDNPFLGSAEPRSAPPANTTQ